MALSHLLRTHTPLRLSVSLHRFSTARHPTRTELDISNPTYMIWGSNTGVGKTVVSTALAFSVLSNLPTNFLYLKPLQTGFPVDSDSRFVHRKVSHLFSGSRGPALGLVGWDRVVIASEGGGKGFRDLDWVEESRVSGKGGDSRLVCETLYGWKEGISPHLAAEREGAWVGDGAVVELLRRRLEVGLRDQGTGWKEEVWRVIETAGGVASPGPSGTLQSDLYRPLRIPAVLVGDGRLGGISATISSYESLKLRGYDVAAVILEDHGLSNEIPLTSYLRNRVDVLVMPPIPQDPSDDLTEWFHNSKQVFNSLRDLLIASNLERIRGLHKLSEKAGKILWWPFTQHGLVPRDSVTVIDSRCGENLAVHKVGNRRELIVLQFDACASWWTQGPDAALQIELAREMGYAASRFGHVMFPENVHEPALHCAELLLKGVGKGWASRVFYSDNGSTAIEVAIKIAFRKYSRDHGIFVDRERSVDGGKAVQFKVLALSGSYHGDTLGAMEAQAPSTYTSFLQQPWYSGRGFFLDPPTVFLSNGKWNISIPEAAGSGECRPEVPSFASCDELFYASRDTSDLAQTYSNFISKQLSQFSQSKETTHIGALIIEPVIHGAGGMHMIDPLFQRILVKVCRSHEIPVIFDEIFTGFWRLGKESAAELLGCLPDVACFGKLMTGGIIPLAATLATEAVFDAFHGDSKAEALLHGHSYTAHAMGCTAAVKSICWFRDPHLNLNISTSRDKLNELWNKEMLLKLSCHSAVKRVVALGTLCVVELKAEGADASYASLYATSLVQKLRENGIYMRPLGNVIYLMCGPCTPPQVCNEQLIKVFHGIEEFSEAQAAKQDLNVM